MMDSTEDKSQDKTMDENKKTSENKSGTDSTETENPDKYKSNKISEPSLDKPNPKDTKITLPLSKRDDHSFSNMSRLSHEDDKIPKKKKKRQHPNLQSLHLK